MNKQLIRSSWILRKFFIFVLLSLFLINPAYSGQETSIQSSKLAPMKYLGADVSALSGGFGGFGGRRSGNTYQDNGQNGDEISIMTKHGWNAFRLRVFLSPVRQAPNNSLENTIELAKQIKAAGAAFQLDIHYSDTWADPQHQETPIAWRNMNIDEMEKQVEKYSSDVIKQLKDAGVMPDMVQVGNEITGGMLWPLGHMKVPPSDVKQFAGEIQALPEPYDDAKQWSNLTRLIKAGLQGVKAGAGDSPLQTIIHIDCGGDWPITKWFFDHLAEANVEFDAIGQSFYPNYHGTLDGLQKNMEQSYKKYNKPIIITETGYPQTGGENVTSQKYMEWPGTPQGQLQFMADLINTAKRFPYCQGVFYWAPEGRGRGNALWNSDGTPAPALLVLNNLEELKNNPESHLPAALASMENITMETNSENDTLNIYVIDTCGGKAMIITTPENETMLIDAGYPRQDNRDTNRVIEAAKSLGIKEFDYVVATHYDTDHSGNIAAVDATIPGKIFFDHGEPIPSAFGNMRNRAYDSYINMIGERKRVSVKPGDTIPVKGLKITVVTAGGKVIEEPLEGAGKPNEFAIETKPTGRRDNNTGSIGLLYEFGKFKMLDLADLLAPEEFELMCPDNKVGTVDLYMVSHHGFSVSNSKFLIHAIAPKVVIMNNGPRKGGEATVYDIIKTSPAMEDLWQLHYSFAAGEEKNTSEQFIANMEQEQDCKGNMIKVSVKQDGTYTVTNCRNDFSITY
ncbi:MAG: glycosyl hydrolase 53 family protein [Sedimentisphaerales bacterium]|nr:glycosyl hydrolase 53 family protein [Sedimentisphaerales bacterium]